MAFRLSDRDRAASQAAAAIRQANRAQADYDQRMGQAQSSMEAAQSKAVNPLESVLSGLVSGAKGLWNAAAGTVNAVAGGIQTAAHDQDRKRTMEDASNKRNEIAKKYGYNSYSEAMNDGNASQDFWNEIKSANNSTSEELNRSKKQYTDSAIYKNLADMSQNKYGADAIRGHQFLTDVLTMGKGSALANTALNTGQGFAGGIADQLEATQDGQEFDWNEALKRGTASAAGGLVGSLVGSQLGNATGDGVVSKVMRSNVGKGAITGGLAGAAGGGTYATLNGGNTLEGALQGLQSGALTGGITGGAMGLLGSGIDKLRGRNAQAQATDVAKAAPMDAEGTEKTNVVGRALKNMGNELEAAQTDITRAERRKFGIKDAGDTVNTLRKRTGLSSLDDQAEFAKNITGAEDSVMDTIQKYNISVDEKGNPITLRADQYEVAINDAVGKDWKKSVMGESYDQFRKDLVQDIMNEDPITASNWLKREAATQRGIADAKGPTSDKAARKAKIYTEVANRIDELSYDAVPQKNVDRMFDDTIDEFYTRAQEAKTAGNKKYAKAYENLAKELDGTERTIANYRTFKKDFVKSSQLADITRGAQSGSLQAGLSKGTNVVNKVLNTALAEPLDRGMAFLGGKLNDLGDVVNGTSTGMAGKAVGAVGKLASGVAGALDNGTVSNSKLGDMANRQLVRKVGLDAANNQDAQSLVQGASQEAQNAQNDYDNAMAQVQQAYSQAQTATQTGTDALDRIARAMDSALAAGDISSYSQLADLYKQAYSIYGLQNPTQTQKQADAKSLSASQSKALTGLQQLQTLSGMSPDLGTALASSPLGGAVNMFGGNDYANQAEALATTIGYLLSGANIKPDEAEALGRGYVPSAFDSEQVRQKKLSRAEQLLRNYLADTTSLEGAY